MDVNMLGKFYDTTRVNRLFYGVEICIVVGDENSGPDTGEILQGSVKIPRCTATGVPRTGSEKTKADKRHRVVL
jgi:hypothetical protein